GFSQLHRAALRRIRVYVFKLLEARLVFAFAVEREAVAGRSASCARCQITKGKGQQPEFFLPSALRQLPSAQALPHGPLPPCGAAPPAGRLRMDSNTESACATMLPASPALAGSSTVVPCLAS